MMNPVRERLDWRKSDGQLSQSTAVSNLLTLALVAN